MPAFFRGRILPRRTLTPTPICWLEVCLALDHFGQPLSDSQASLGSVTIDLNQPYESNLVTTNGRDASFTVFDLESVLRWPDWDAPSLPDRLSGLGTLTDNYLNSRTVTTRSFEIPVASAVTNPSQRMALGVQLDTLALLGASSDDMIPFELIRGYRMNLNRQFGDGIDNNSNDIIDDPAENEALAWNELSELLNDADTSDTAPYDYSADVSAPVRQLYARHLYCLLMLSRETGVNVSNATSRISGFFDPTAIAAGQGHNRSAAILAQWAVNVVDFADADAIMTPFEFDMNLSDGWDVDGDLEHKRRRSFAVSFGVLSGPSC